MTLERLLTLGLAMVLLGLAIFFAVRQRSTWKTTRLNPSLPAEERTFFMRQVRRRLLCSFFMALFAALLGGWFFFEPHVTPLRPAPAAPQIDGEDLPPADPNQAFLQLVTLYWMAALAVLFCILCLAGLDFLATTRYGMRQRRRLASDQHAVLALEVARLRYRNPENN